MSTRELKLNGLLNQLAMNCSLRDKTADRFALVLDPTYENLLTKERQDRLREALADFYKKTISLEIEVKQAEKETPAMQEKREEQAKLAAAAQAIESDANVKKILDTFQAQGVTNVHAYQAESQEGGFVLGVIAALMSKTGVLGVAGPVEAGDAKLFVDGFAAGAKYARPDVKVNISYTGSFSDVSLMAAAANTHISAGADMLTGSSQSVVGAIGVAKDQGAYWFGTQWDQTPIAPDTVVASQIFDWTGIIKDIIDSASKGVLGGKAYTLTFKNKGLVLKYNDAVEVPDEIKAAAEAAIQGIMNGEIDPLP